MKRSYRPFIIESAAALLLTFAAPSPSSAQFTGLRSIAGRPAAPAPSQATADILAPVVEFILGDGLELRFPAMTSEDRPTRGEPVNLIVIGRPEWVEEAFRAAGWTGSERHTPISLLKMAISYGVELPYKKAPISAQRLLGRRQDFGFQQSASSPHERCHLRLWRATEGLSGAEGDSIVAFIGAASHDTRIIWNLNTRIPTHDIAPEVDYERDHVVDSLSYGGWARRISYRHSSTQQSGRNVWGSDWETDGRLAVIYLSPPPGERGGER